MAFPTAQFKCLPAARGRFAKARDNQGGSRGVGSSAAQQLSIHVVVGSSSGIVAVIRLGGIPGCGTGVVIAVVPFFDQLTHVAQLYVSRSWGRRGLERTEASG